jgi:hypothetical protein
VILWAATTNKQQQNDVPGGTAAPTQTIKKSPVTPKINNSQHKESSEKPTQKRNVH